MKSTCLSRSYPPRARERANPFRGCGSLGARVLNQLAPAEGVGDSREIEVVDRPTSPVELELVGDEETISPRLLGPSFAQVEEAGPSSPPREKIIA